MPQESTISSQYIYKGRILNLRLDIVQLSDGKTTRREIIEHGQSVVIVALDEDGNVLLVRQYRKAVEKALLEAPAGGMDPGEDPLAAAVRELEEETGYTAGKLERVGGFYASPGYCSEYLHLFLATDLKEGRARPESDEEIELVKVPLSDIPSLIKKEEIQDSKSVAGLLQAILLR